jgi:hypothetical protein
MHTLKRDFNYQLLQMHPTNFPRLGSQHFGTTPKRPISKEEISCRRAYVQEITGEKKTLESFLLMRYALLAEKTKRILSNLTYCAPTTSLAFSYYSAKEYNCIFTQRSSNPT